MKKILNVLLFCVTIVGLTYFFWSNPDITNEIGNEIRQNVFTKEVKTYTNDFEINRLKVLNSNYYYNLLTPEQKKIYDFLAISVKNLDNNFIVKGYNVVNQEDAMVDVAAVMDAFFNDHPEVFYLSTEYKVSTSQMISGYSVQVFLEYFVEDIQDLEEKITQIESTVNNITKDISTTNIFEAELKVHDKISEITTYYDYTDINNIPKETHGIYGTFVSKTAVCDGFTKAMQILLDKMNIESILVTGTLQGQPHAWNMVKLENDWYNLDLTSNKTLQKDFNNSNLTIHSYFNVTSKEIKDTHIIANESSIPSATATKYNYYIYTDKYIYNTDNFSAKLKDILNKDLGNDILEYSTSNTSIAVDKMSEVFQNKKYFEYTQVNTKGFKYYKILNTYVITKY